jgi:hypothetical protein
MDARRAVAVLAEVTGGEWMKSAEIVAKMRKVRETAAFSCEAFPEAVLTAVLNAQAGLSAKSLGKWLRNQQDRVLGGFTIQSRLNNVSNTFEWNFKRTG